ncbi:MAG: type II toxin-antitoxin system RelE/ParE family toxin [Anaerolineaceae bacterium]|nr:type II toxin-antitoxin system RelE/ParE family toxin [Anaerolineaceae bacterium]
MTWRSSALSAPIPATKAGSPSEIRNQKSEIRNLIKALETSLLCAAGMYLYVYGGKIILTHGFIKKTEETPRKEILTAIQYKKDYIKRYGGKR